MKKIIAMLTLTLLVASLAASALAWDYYRATDYPTYVRTGPGLSYKIMDKLSTGGTYTYLGDISWDNRGVAWYSVYYGGGPNGWGWVSSLQGDLVDASTGSVHFGGDYHH